MQAQSPVPVPGPQTLYLIDGSGYIFRAYHALPPLTNPQGTPVGAVYGFLTMMLKLMAGTKADYVAVVFDTARKTFRSRIYPEYKAHRPPPPDDLIPQFALVREAADALSIPRVEMDDVEADDLIAAYAKLARHKGMEVVILSSDKDLMQLIGDGVRLHDPMKDRAIGPREVEEKFGVGPERVRDVLALIGDASDNVPGVPGIGPKTAAELIGQYGTLEALLAHAHEIKQPKRRETLEQNAARARMSYELITLKDDFAVPAPLESFALRQPDAAALQAFLQSHGFNSLVTRLKDKFNFSTETKVAEPASAPALATAAAPRPVTAQYALIQDESTLERWIDRAREQGIVAVDTETTGLDAMQAELVGISLSTAPGIAAYIPLGHTSGGAGMFSQRVHGQLEPKLVLELLKPLLTDAGVLKVGQNIKYDLLLLKRYGVDISPIDDTMLLSYALAAGLHGHGMDELAELHLQHKCISYDDVTGTGKQRISFAEVALDKARDYAAEDADITLRLWHHLRPQVAAQHLLTLYETIERPLVPVLVDMESKGIRVDVNVLKSLSGEFAQKMAVLEKEIHQLAGMEFNVGSPKQLGEVLFEKHQLPGGKKSGKTGAYSTDSGVLEDLAEQGYPLPAKVIEWRQLAKLKNTYTDALVEQINPQTHRVHTSFAMAVAATGRLSSTDPNLQNIPIRTVEGKKIRHAFVAEAGCKLISADYSQIELRLLAHMADIAPLKAAFKNGDDIHAITASDMFGVPVNEVSADLRRSAKTINFGIIYGISAHGLATRLGIGRNEAAAYIERYFARYPGIRDYMESCKEFARAHGYVETLFGRRCHLRGIRDKNAAVRQFAERQAINAPLQGTAADIIKKAMLVIHRQLAESRLKTSMLLQVHDELVFEAAESDVEATLALVKPAMEKTVQVSVPLTVQAGAGDNWGEIH